MLIGLVLGLAIYNAVILDFPLPLALYKKLLGQQTTLRDLQDMDPTLGKSLQQLLAYEGEPRPGIQRSCLMQCGWHATVLHAPGAVPGAGGVGALCMGCDSSPVSHSLVKVGGSLQQRLQPCVWCGSCVTDGACWQVRARSLMSSASPSQRACPALVRSCRSLCARMETRSWSPRTTGGTMWSCTSTLCSTPPSTSRCAHSGGVHRISMRAYF